jgi:DNA gyrase/topoisomerase IV subunit A
MHYRYGDNALYETIVGMGSYCVGTNNVPLIKAIGQYRSREASDKAGADRYIEAFKPDILEYIFRKEDDCILEYKYEGSD